MDLQRLSAHAERLRASYAQHNVDCGRDEWDTVDYVAGFAGDVGQLSQLVMAFEGRRDAPDDLPARLEHEVNDCLWSVLVIAGRLGVDLGRTFPRHIEAVVASIAVGESGAVDGRAAVTSAAQRRSVA